MNKIKQNEIPFHNLKVTKLKAWQWPNVGKDVEQGELIQTAA